MPKAFQKLAILFNTQSSSSSGYTVSDFCSEQVLRRATNNDLSDKEIRQMAKNIDINQDGQIDVNEFLEAFTLVWRKDS